MRILAGKRESDLEGAGADKLHMDSVLATNLRHGGELLLAEKLRHLPGGYEAGRDEGVRVEVGLNRRSIARVDVVVSDTRRGVGGARRGALAGDRPEVLGGSGFQARSRRITSSYRRLHTRSMIVAVPMP